MPHRVRLRGRPDQLYLYSGRSVLITNLDGEVTGQGSEGLHVDNTRLLSEDWVAANGERLEAVSISPVGADAMLGYYEVQEGDGVPRRTVFVEQARFIGGGLATRLWVTNYGIRDPVRLSVAWHLAADFADTDDTERGERRVEIPTERTWDGDAQCLSWVSAEERIAARVDLHFAGARADWDDGALRFSVEVPARERVELTLTATPIIDAPRRAPQPAFAAPPRGLAALRQSLRDEAPELRSSNATVERAWATAVADLASLPLGLDDGPAAPIAGLPLYQQFFGRDTLTIGWQALPAMPTLLRDALRANAAWQGKRIDDWRDEEPGKMIHQARWGPVSRVGIDPFTRYYGDWATVPDFLVMLGQYLAWTADFETVRDLLPAARAAIDWLERYGDLDRDGFIEYRTRSKDGVKNQGWLDSDDAIVDEHGDIVPNPIATAELQAYAYAGFQQAALVFAGFGDAGYAAELLRRAHRLRRRFDAAFWLEDLGFYAKGLRPGGRPIRSLASNAGHLLAGGLVPPVRGRAVARRLMQPDMFSGWGIRTLSSEHPAFNPFSYHRGSVWPVEQATIGFGFARYGAWDELGELAGALFDTAELFAEARLPEVVGGVQRDAEHPHPGVYPDSCEPQGWSASAVVQMVQALLGMVAVAPAKLLIIDPHLPVWLPDLRLDGLRVGSGVVDLRFERHVRGNTRFGVRRRRGFLAVVRQPPPQAPNATPWGRLAAALASIAPRGDMAGLDGCR